jgi:hypothetical protein
MLSQIRCHALMFSPVINFPLIYPVSYYYRQRRQMQNGAPRDFVVVSIKWWRPRSSSQPWYYLEYLCEV